MFVLQMRTQVNFWIHHSFLKWIITLHMRCLGGRRRMTKLNQLAANLTRRNTKRTILVFKFLLESKGYNISIQIFRDYFYKRAVQLKSKAIRHKLFSSKYSFLHGRLFISIKLSSFKSLNHFTLYTFNINLRAVASPLIVRWSDVPSKPHLLIPYINTLSPSGNR